MGESSFSAPHVGMGNPSTCFGCFPEPPFHPGILQPPGSSWGRGTGSFWPVWALCFFPSRPHTWSRGEVAGRQDLLSEPRLTSSPALPVLLGRATPSNLEGRQASLLLHVPNCCSAPEVLGSKTQAKRRLVVLPTVQTRALEHTTD